MNVTILPQTLAVCRLDPAAAVPSWIRGAFTTVTRSDQELSIVCDEASVPDDVRAERGWRAFRVEGPIAFEMVGVAASLLAPLAADGISVFMIATFDTDYVLVKAEMLERAADALRGAGHVVF